jgi:hypothetical protein
MIRIALGADTASLAWIDLSGKLPGCTTGQDTCDQEDGFNIERKLPGGQFVFLFKTGANVQAFDDVTSAPGACYRVIAFNEVGVSGYSNVACRKSPPAAPGGVTVTTKLQVTGSINGNNLVVSSSPPTENGIHLVVAEKIVGKGKRASIVGTATLITGGF